VERSDATHPARHSSIPLTLITGFLGSGKSTFINHAIRSNAQTRFGVLVNEFGNIGIENEIIKAHEDDVVELEGGCMCCRLRGDLVEALRSLLSHADSIDQVLVEASGLSDPLPIANTFHGTNLESRVHFDAMICMIDALHFHEAYRDYTVAVRQLNYAGFLLITKAHACSGAHLEALRARLSGMAPEARIGVLDVDISAADVIGAAAELTALQGLLFSDGRSSEHHGSGHSQEHPELTVRLCTTEEPTSKDAVDQALRRLGPQLLRAKGRIFVSTPEGPYVYYVVQGVAGIREFYPCPRTADQGPRSALLLVATDGSELRLPDPLGAWDIQPVSW
jgi:G3E family GTPase